MPTTISHDRPVSRPCVLILEPRLLLSGGGDLDTAFGDDGVVTVPDSASSAQLTDLVVLSDGRYMMTGTSVLVSGGNQLTVQRFYPDGTPDTTFGVNGAATSVIGGDAEVFGIALQPNLQPIVVGSTGNDYFVLRYLTNGKHDKTFGNGGLVSNTFQANRSVARDVVVNSDGTITIVGDATLAGGTTAVGMARLQSNGSIDQSFGSFGTLVTKFSFPVNNQQSFSVNRMTVDGAGNFVIGGRFLNTTFNPQAGDDAVAVMRVTPDGSPDATFSDDGLSLADFNVLGESATGVAVDPILDRPLVSVGGVNVFGVLRLLTNGRRDSGFGINGLARVTNSAGDTNDVLVDDNNDYVLAGSIGTQPRVVRMFTDGLLDNTFGSNGITAPVPFTSTALLARIVESPDDTYLVGGTGNTGSSTGRQLQMAKYFAQDEPVGSLNAKNLNQAQTSSYVFTVTWRDPLGIDTTTLGNSNVRVTGPGGYARNGVLVSVDTSLGLTQVTAKYKVAAPTGGWTSANNGTYTVFVNANQVADLDDNFAPAGTLGTFAVAIA